MLYLTKFTQNIIISTYNQHKIMNDIFYFFFHTKSLKSGVFFHPYITSQFRIATFQVLNRHVW